MPALSVVVPFQNVAGYIEACLTSLRLQTFDDLEVVLVDDGSTDGTRTLVDAVVAADRRFRVVAQDNAGPGPARNRGVSEATGEFLAFVDADDVVHLDAYARLVGMLRSSGSDLAVGGVQRFSNLGMKDSFTHKAAITATAQGTHITQRSELVMDRMVWNKVYRRAFWDREGLRFPALMMGEDFPVSMAAHVRAKQVDVTTDIVYYWRERDGGEPSITQRSAELNHLDDRLASAFSVLDIIETGAPDSLAELREYFMAADVTAVTIALLAHPEDEHAAILDRAAALIDRLGVHAADHLNPFYRAQVALVHARDARTLLELHHWGQRYGRIGPVEERGRWRKRYVERLPGVDDPRVGAAYVTGPPKVEAGVQDGWWDVDGRLIIQGLVTAPFALGDETAITARLVAEEQDPIPLTLTRVVRHRPILGDDLAGFEIRLDPRDIAIAARNPATLWLLQLTIDHPTHRRTVFADLPSFGLSRHIPPRSMPSHPEFQVQPHHSGRGFGLLVRTPLIALTSSAVQQEEIVLDGRLAEPTETVEIEVIGPHGAATRYPGTVEGATFQVRIPATALAERPAYDNPVAVQTTLTAYAYLDGTRRELPLDPGFNSSTALVGTRAVTAARSFRSTLQFLEEPAAARVRRVTWLDETTLRFEVDAPRPELVPDELLMLHFEHPAGGVRRVVPTVRSPRGGSRYLFDVDTAELIRLHAQDRDSYDGPRRPEWHLLISLDGRPTPQKADRDAYERYARPRDVDGSRVALHFGRADVVQLKIGD